ncbi:hypothetical protein [Pseudomonas tolaasii]
MILKERVYELIIGNYKTGNGLLLRSDGNDPESGQFTYGSNIVFSFTRDSDNARTPNSGEIAVYNLSREHLKLVDGDFTELTLSVGYASNGPRLMVKGNVIEMSTRKNGTDRITTFKVGEAYSALNHKKVKGIVSAGKKVEDCIDFIRTAMDGDVTKGSYRGDGLQKPITNGISMHGTPKEQLTRLCKANDLEWNISGGVLNVTGKNMPSSKNTVNAIVLNEDTGLLDVPYYTSAEGKKLPKDKTRKRGVHFTALLNPDLLPGAIVKIEDPDITGFFRINTAQFAGNYRGDSWYVDCFCSEITAEELV